MSVSQLLKWQWDGYSRYHGSRANLLLHIVLVPLFVVANVTAVAALIEGAWLVAILAIAAMVVAVALQGGGHRREQTPPEPFTGPVNALARIFSEQWVTFPRFVLSGGWSHAMRAAR
jgi:hypothetical protein